MERDHHKHIMIEFSPKNFRQCFNLSSISTKDQNVSFVPIFEHVSFCKQFIIDCFLNFFDHVFFFRGHVLYVDWEHAT
jgi:hypothetical protein